MNAQNDVKAAACPNNKNSATCQTSMVEGHDQEKMKVTNKETSELSRRELTDNKADRCGSECNPILIDDSSDSEATDVDSDDCYILDYNPFDDANKGSKETELAKDLFAGKGAKIEINKELKEAKSIDDSIKVEPSGKKAVGSHQRKQKEPRKDILGRHGREVVVEVAEDCYIVEFYPPDDDIEGIELSKLSIYCDSADEDVEIVAEKGKVACRDYPHPRHLCALYPFGKTPDESHCKMCHCYLCEVVAPCKSWSKSHMGHCHATDRDLAWRIERETRQKTPAY